MFPISINNSETIMKASVLVKLTCILIVLVLLRQFYIDICNFPDLFPEKNIYESYGISDWLVNYRAGFVRRGLAGEILWQIYQLHPFPVVYVLSTLNIICLVGLAILCACLFKRMGWPIWLLLFPMFLYYRFYGLGMGILDTRRDGLILLFAFLLFKQYKSYLAGGGVFMIWLMSFLILLVYEGIFFSVFPFLALHTWMFLKTSFVKRCLKMLYLWWPVGIMLLILVFIHGDDGDTNIPDIIWQSWKPCFETYPYGHDMPSIGPGVEWLSKTLKSNGPLAFSISWKSSFIGCLPCWPFNIYTIIAIYYLFTRMDMFSETFTQVHRTQISNILILQLLFIMPMLGLIANDWYRSVPYCCITTCFLCYLFRDSQYVPVPSFVNRTSRYIQTTIEKSKMLNNPWVYYIILVTLPLCLYNARPGGMFPFIPIDMKSRLIEMIIG